MFVVGMLIRLVILFYMVKFIIFLFKEMDKHGY